MAAGCAGRGEVAPAKPAVAPVKQAPPLTATQRMALKSAGMAAYEAKDWPTCAKLLEQVGDNYDAACCHAHAGDRDRAFALLDKAIRVDHFTNAVHIANDPDLASLHEDPRWQAIPEAVEAARKDLNAELLQIHDEDQADRQKPYDQIDWSVVRSRDQARRKRVDEIVKAGGAKVAVDYYHAAMVFQHGDTPEEYQRAHDLATQAVALDPNHHRARWLAAASEDRKLMHAKKPQKWGTQYQKRDGKWVLWEVDPSITDEQRADWNVPPIAEARARAEQMNAPSKP